ncbi:MAG: hypothetical protein CVU57_14155 [Deltaproteobacteria bacterium HGW-Deltaproteobacteria-15]|nr:MAG: hypothetical protein CVU57_14155 [Deltaproteobacteria bacterium HGW-Deltaproteobacteria-15]
MREKETLHGKVQKLIDCFATSDPLKEMAGLPGENDRQEAALKWLALAVIHGINSGAKEISVLRSEKGEVRVMAEYKKAELPSPGVAIGSCIMESLRSITHLEGEKGKTLLAMGVRDGSIDLNIKLKRRGEEEKLTLKFPD